MRRRLFMRSLAALGMLIGAAGLIAALAGGILFLFTSLANAGTITVTLDGSPVTLTTTGDHDFAVADAVSKVNVQITEQNARNQADNDAALAAWNAENARRAALTPPLDPLPAPVLKTISPTLTTEQWVSEQITGVLNGLGSSYRDRMLGTAKDAFLAATPEQKVAVCAALGLVGKLPECP